MRLRDKEESAEEEVTQEKVVREMVRQEEGRLKEGPGEKRQEGESDSGKVVGLGLCWMRPGRWRRLQHRLRAPFKRSARNFCPVRGALMPGGEARQGWEEGIV